MDFRYTKHQTARGARADAETYDRLHLVKVVASLRLTYQIRLLTFRATEERKRLIIAVPRGCQIHPALQEFVRRSPKFVRIERVLDGPLPVRV